MACLVLVICELDAGLTPHKLTPPGRTHKDMADGDANSRGQIPPRGQVLTAAQSGAEKYEFVLVLLTTMLVGSLRALIIAL